LDCLEWKRQPIKWRASLSTVGGSLSTASICTDPSINGIDLHRPIGIMIIDRDLEAAFGHFVQVSCPKQVSNLTMLLHSACVKCTASVSEMGMRTVHKSESDEE